ncbi:hypothetical protein AURDEDRAFT_173107 [Auricularia subglabra TFB-10046 SS5]|nr:hypothetical protein AURDEDRAFT_173107 [Auricularia subglabra TFB-10046 SS5]
MSIDHAALRVTVTRQFNALTHGSTSADGIRPICDALLQATRDIVQDLMRDWSAAHEDLYRIPTEILAACFAFLPLRDRITASHVSRQWRAVALAYPAVWSHIHLPSGLRDAPAVLAMALSRTGCHPVDLSGVAPEVDSVGGLRCLREHMHHIRSIHWPTCNVVPFRHPAPMLHLLVGLPHAVFVSPNLLGCEVGKLKTLYLDSPYISTYCPALSTVTTLGICCSKVPRYAESLRALFDLCPRLESLRLSDLQQDLAHFLPAGPAPQSLRCLELHTPEAFYDLTQHYLDWKTDTLTEVALELGGGTPRFDRLIHNPTKLRVARGSVFERTAVVASAPGARASVDYGDLGDYASHVSSVLLLARERLRGVRSLELPASALPRFAEVLAALPQLDRLVLAVGSENVSVPSRRFAWDALGALSGLQALCPSLKSLDINVGCWDDSRPPSREDARDLVSQLETVEWWGPLDVNIFGFSEGDLLELKLPPRISFVT